MTRPAVLALDLSLTATGFAHDERAGRITTSPDRPIEARLDYLVGGISIEILDHLNGNPDLVVIEDFVTRSPAASLLGMVHGAVRLHLHRSGIPTVLIPPKTLKKFATGRGNATKGDMRIAHLQRFGHDLRDDNEVDARWLHTAALTHYGHPPVTLPATQVAALDAVTWPTLTPQEHAA